MKTISSIYINILAIGVSDKFSNTKNKRIKLLNTYSLIWMHFSILFTIADLISGLYFKKTLIDHFIRLTTFCILFTIIQLNKKHYFNYARFLWIITAFFIFNLSSLIVNPGIYTEYYFVIISGVSLSLYTNNTISVICTFLSFICFLIPYYFMDIYPQDYKDRIHFTAILALFFSVYFLVNYFKKLNLVNEKKLEIAYQKLEETKKSELAYLQLKSLKAQMNPHFMFNAMNSIQNLVIKGDKEEAYNYLTKFSSLIRENLNMSEKSFVYFEEELSLLKKYLELEKLRFREGFEYQLEGIGTIGDIKIPSMIIQPFVENAIKHGLLHKMDGLKKVTIEFFQEDIFKCIITDNGIGVEASKKINTLNNSKYHSFSTKAIKDRLELLRGYYKLDIGFEYKDIEKGTQVVLKIPYKYDD